MTAKPERGQTPYTLEEVAEHNTPSDLWIAIDGVVYCIPESWQSKHPGGLLHLHALAGRDVSEPFRAYHPEALVARYLKLFRVGIVTDYQPSPLRTSFLEMAREIERAGLTKTDMRYYAVRAAVLTTQMALTLLTLYYAAVFSSHMLYIAAALQLGMFWQQMAFIGHDVGHNAVYQDSEEDHRLSLLINVLFGVSGKWWKKNHNFHHIVTNSVDYDPDIQHMPVLAVTPSFFEDVFSYYYQKVFSFDLPARLLVSYQHVLYWPIMAFVARYNLHLHSILLALDIRKPMKHRALEILSLSMYFAWYLLLLWSIPSWVDRLLVHIVSHAMVGLVHIQITISHFAMETHRGCGYDDVDHFIRTQFATTLDVSCPKWLDWFHGGLQFQVPHHLFPRIPRHNLRRVRDDYVRPFALKHHIEYHELPFGEANALVLRILRETAYAARSQPVKGRLSNILLQAMRMEG